MNILSVLIDRHLNLNRIIIIFNKKITQENLYSQTVGGVMTLRIGPTLFSTLIKSFRDVTRGVKSAKSRGSRRL